MQILRDPFHQTIVKLGNFQIISSSDELFNHFDNDLPMWSETGDRFLTRKFQFRSPFNLIPSLVVGLCGIDNDCGRNLRCRVEAESITANDFVVRFSTWGDTRIARASIFWQAIGEPIIAPSRVKK